MLFLHHHLFSCERGPRAECLGQGGRCELHVRSGAGGAPASLPLHAPQQLSTTWSLSVSRVGKPQGGLQEAASQGRAGGPAESV